MGSLQNILELISVYVASIDLKDAFNQYIFTKTIKLPWHFLQRNIWNLYVCQTDMDQSHKYLQRFQKDHFLFLQKKVSYL